LKRLSTIIKMTKWITLIVFLYILMSWIIRILVDRYFDLVEIGNWESMGMFEMLFKVPIYIAIPIISISLFVLLVMRFEKRFGWIENLHKN